MCRRDLLFAPHPQHQTFRPQIEYMGCRDRFRGICNCHSTGMPGRFGERLYLYRFRKRVLFHRERCAKGNRLSRHQCPADIFQFFQIFDSQMIFLGKQIERRHVFHVSRRGDDSFSAQIRHRLLCHSIGTAQMTGQQTDDMFSPLIQHQHCRIRCLGLHQRSNGTHHDTCRHDKHQCITVCKRPPHCFCKICLWFHHAAEVCLQLFCQLFPLRCQPEIRRFHASVPFRNSWVNVLSYSFDRA